MGKFLNEVIKNKQNLRYFSVKAKRFSKTTFSSRESNKNYRKLNEKKLQLFSKISKILTKILQAFIQNRAYSYFII